MRLKDFILANMEQSAIFARFLEIPESDILDSIKFKNYKLSNPNRDDPVPSLSFRYYGDKLICKDFGDINYRGDIFEVVGYILNLNCRDPKQFVEICNAIISSVDVKKAKERDATTKINIITDIDINERPFTNSDFKYFAKYKLDPDVVKTSYIPVKGYFINGIKSSYNSSSSDPCFAYTNNPQKIKLVFPYRNGKEKYKSRFVTNNKFPIELVNLLKPTNHIVLIKAYKDKLLMDLICDLLSIDDILFLPLASESARINNKIAKTLREFAKVGIFTLLDIDKPGLESANVYNTEFGFPSISFSDDIKMKDPTDMSASIGLKQTIKKFNSVYEIINRY